MRRSKTGEAIVMAEQWKFVQDEQSQWRWTHTDENDRRVESKASFENQAQCILDAIRFAINRRRASAADADGSSQAH
jgi:hypothetical protein